MTYINDLLGFDKLLITFLIALVLYWIFTTRNKKSSKSDFNKYYEDIINSDKYKVKGKFESNK